MDDFIFGEPTRRSVPEPGTAGLLAVAALAAWGLRRRSRGA
jgi:hypothetical protein